MTDSAPHAKYRPLGGFWRVCHELGEGGLDQVGLEVVLREERERCTDALGWAFNFEGLGRSRRAEQCRRHGRG